MTGMPICAVFTTTPTVTLEVFQMMLVPLGIQMSCQALFRDKKAVCENYRNVISN
jgi:hypothetical protein